MLKSKDDLIEDLTKRNQSLVSAAESNEVFIHQLKDQVALLESSDASPLSFIKIASLESELEILRMENMRISSVEAELDALKAGKTSTIQTELTF